jgi:hypothetical protein
MQIKPATYLMTIRAILLNGVFKEGINFLSVQVNVFASNSSYFSNCSAQRLREVYQKGMQVLVERYSHVSPWPTK